MRAFASPYAQPPTSFVAPNYYDQLLYRDYGTMDNMRRSGLLQAMCCPSAYSGDNPPWIVMPPGGKRFQNIGNVDILTMTEGVETTVVQFRVPDGWEGVITGHFNLCATLNQLVEASGDVTWRIKNNRRYIEDYGDITTTLGSLASPTILYRGGFRLVSHQTIKYTATLGVGGQAALGSGRIIVGLQGWFYPMT